MYSRTSFAYFKTVKVTFWSTSILLWIVKTWNIEQQRRNEIGWTVHDDEQYSILVEFGRKKRATVGSKLSARRNMQNVANWWHPEMPVQIHWQLLSPSCHRLILWTEKCVWHRLRLPSNWNSCCRFVELCCHTHKTLSPKFYHRIRIPQMKRTIVNSAIRIICLHISPNITQERARCTNK